MRVVEIYNDCKSWIGTTDQATVFSLISDAVATLARKGGWDARKCYLDLPTNSGNLVTLPSFVESVVKCNVSNTPSVSRDRIYEFSLNGPGNSAARTDYSWEDRGFAPTLVTLPSASRLLVAATSGGDIGLKIAVVGLDANNNQITDVITLAGTDVATTQSYTKILEVNKDATTNTVSLYATANGTAHTTLLSTYQPYETQCQYRQIRLSKTGVTAHLLVLRKTFRVYSMDDFIPVQSALGLRLMIKALVAYQRTDSGVARAFEEDAVRITTEAQKDTTTFVDLAKETEMDTARGLTYNNRDSVIVADIYDDVCKIVGPIGQYKVFDKITEALEALHNKGHWDGLVGYVDILTDGGQYLTLPRYVESPLAVNVGGYPMIMRNKWFEFHANGPGSLELDGAFPSTWDWVGDVPVQQPLQYDVQLVAVPDSNSDDNKSVTIYGLDQNQKPLGNGSGYTFTVDHTKLLPNNGDQQISRIDRITRDATNNFVRFIGYKIGDTTQSVQLGYWYPDETEPQYLRIRLPTYSNWVRMRYRKRTLKISSIYDQVNLKSKLALICMVRSIEERYAGNKDKADDFETKAFQYISEEQMSRNPGEHFDLQFSPTFGGDNLILI